ncbi:BolA family transcriptional regulator [Acidisoma cellulosilytica]|uniref:BolA family transcriptional regulator n=1 Tax=Acidisoma cellulosilyticum TaxID=2802395 RepID=A0A964E2V0_9PROT|nr:BolA family protein [Acidisoma cellulosilyticum]MCB8880020.1 BolA family transcriptional regulator [Acidisoma cellulosilyticum]
MSRQTRITDTLSRAFVPLSLVVEDDSARHIGHAGHPGGAGQGGESHFNVTMVADCFASMNRVARARAVNEALADEFAGGLHALSLTLRAPAEIAGTIQS